MKTHQKSRTKEYRCWVRMKHRCHNPGYQNYHRYGGRGIKVCQGWRDSFLSFLEDMGLAPTPAHSIDRKKNGLGYYCGHCAECLHNGWEPNCQWATWKEQGNNRRTNVVWQHPTQPHLCFTIAEWAARLKLSRKCLWKRKKLGWPLERILTRDGVLPAQPVKKAA